MKSNVIEYKGYHTIVEFDYQDSVLRGKIEGIVDYVDFECEDAKDVEKEFHSAVDEYLIFCEEVGKEPQKEYNGVFNVRIKPELHRKMAMRASKENKKLNTIVEEAIREYISEKDDERENIKVTQQQFNVKYSFKEKESEEGNPKIVNFRDRVKMKYEEG